MEPEDLYVNHSVYSGDLVHVPYGDQSDWWAGSNAPKPVHDDILIAKLRPGQKIECEIHCEKGIGREHAKWSPVGPFSKQVS